MNKFLALFALYLVPLLAFSQQNMSSLIEQKAMAIQSKLVEWRRYIHQHPELSNREYKTGEFIAEHLKESGIEVKTPVAKTGVVGILKGAKNCELARIQGVRGGLVSADCHRRLSPPAGNFTTVQCSVLDARLFRRYIGNPT